METSLEVLANQIDCEIERNRSTVQIIRNVIKQIEIARK